MNGLPPRYRSRLAGVLVEAGRAYRCREDEAFRALLNEAAELAPERLDLRNCLASHHIQNGRPESALAIYEEICDLVPADVDALFRLAHWRRFLGDAGGAEATRSSLFAIRPDRAAVLSRIWEILDAWFAKPVRDDIPNFGASALRPAILALGYALSVDGSPLPELLFRLEKTREAALRHPAAMIIVSGGLPRAGRAEAVVMREWLEAAGIPSGRIAEEGYSRDVVENLIYSRVIAAMNRVDEILIVTSAIDVRRAGASMEIMAGACGDSWVIQVVASAAGCCADTGDDRLKAYRDALRASGMPMMNAYPELAER